MHTSCCYSCIRGYKDMILLLENHMERKWNVQWKLDSHDVRSTVFSVQSLRLQLCVAGTPEYEKILSQTISLLSGAQGFARTSVCSLAGDAFHVLVASLRLSETSPSLSQLFALWLRPAQGVRKARQGKEYSTLP